MRLKQLPLDARGNPERYVCLSYVWGSDISTAARFITTRKNIMARIQSRGESKSDAKAVFGRLPRTLEHVFVLVKKLRFRYLWIDSLCIVQDSSVSWELNAKSMHLVYANAHFTICAADGDSGSGLVAAALETMQEETSTTPTGTTTQAEPLIAECAPGLRLLVTRSPERVIRESEWNHRGWTLQERLLSRRCLIFAQGQVYFQCRSSVMFRDIFGGADSKSWSLDMADSPLISLGLLHRRAFRFYMMCVELYTGRNLTKPRDILSAFEGISRLLEGSFSVPLLQGLPISHLDLALLWLPTRAHHRQTTSSSDCTCSAAETCRGHTFRRRTGDSMEFPSWSWCGWMGGASEYQLHMLEGPLLNPREWLLNHTWILWYVRDREGGLRPLWSYGEAMEDTSGDQDWRGYLGLARRSTRFGFDATLNVSGYPHSRRTYTTEREREDKAREQLLHEAETLQQHHVPRTQAPMWRHKSNTGYLDRLVPGYYDDGISNPRTLGRASQGTFRPRTDGGAGDTEAGTRSRQRWRERPFSTASPPLHPRSSRTKDAGPARPYRREIRIYDDEDENEGEDEGEDVEMGFEKYYDRSSTSSISSISSVTTSWSHQKRTRRRVQFRPTTEPPTDNLPFDRLDQHGRTPQPGIPPGTDFDSIIPEHPFGLSIGPFIRDSQDMRGAMPILQFWTWRSLLHVVTRQRDDVSTGNEPVAVPGRGFSQCDILDNAGDWCGAIALPQAWIEEREGESLVFIALSDAKSFTKSECPVWNYYIPKERDDCCWDLYYVMFLERNERRALWERVGLGKVFKACFGDSVWDEIKLG